ncbi:uncharacterized protein DS421_14g467580 [Arachis hypogaea]|nr:uncharacterized protein DS421_14g467580 [Arachis hypogaea]
MPKISPASGPSYAAGYRPGAQYATPPSYDYGMLLTSLRPLFTLPSDPPSHHQYATVLYSGGYNVSPLPPPPPPPQDPAIQQMHMGDPRPTRPQC